MDDFGQFQPPVCHTLDREITQIWWLANMEYKQLKLWLLCCCFCYCHLICLSPLAHIPCEVYISELSKYTQMPVRSELVGISNHLRPMPSILICFEVEFTTLLSNYMIVCFPSKKTYDFKTMMMYNYLSKSSQHTTRVLPVNKEG